METKSSSWGMLFLFIGIFSLFLIGLVQGTQLKKNESLTMQVNELTSFDYVNNVVKNMGLAYNNENIIIIND